MNNYGKWWDTTITLYNRIEEDKKIKWYRHVISECFYKHTQDSLKLGQTVVSSDVSICRIKVSKDFVTKREYVELSDMDRKDMFTLSPNDIIVPEETDFEIDEYTKGSRSSDLLSKYREYPGCFTIDTVNVNIGGERGNQHYLAKGN